MKLRGVSLAAALALAACTSPTSTPTPEPTSADATQTPGPTSPVALWLENRGGPAFEVRIGSVVIATVACDGGVVVIPGEGGAPALPWDLAIVRVRDGTLLAQAQLAELSRYFVQIGGEVVASLTTSPVAGPGGPLPSGSWFSRAPSSRRRAVPRRRPRTPAHLRPRAPRS